MHTYLRTCIRICIHTCIHTYVHTYLHTYTYVHTYIHSYIHTYIHTYIHFMYGCIMGYGLCTRPTRLRIINEESEGPHKINIWQCRPDQPWTLGRETQILTTASLRSAYLTPRDCSSRNFRHRRSRRGTSTLHRPISHQIRLSLGSRGNEVDRVHLRRGLLHSVGLQTSHKLKDQMIFTWLVDTDLQQRRIELPTCINDAAEAQATVKSPLKR